MSEVFLNPSAGRSVGNPAPTREPMRFHQSFPGYAVTPLVHLPGLAQRLGIGTLWLKDESSRLGLPAFKILGASWAVHCALRELAGLRSDTMLTLDELREIAANHRPTFFSATDGNHGRAVARMARLLGAQAQIYMPEGTASARINAIEAEGATVIVGGSYDDAVVKAERDAYSKGLLVQDSAWGDYKNIPEWIVQGYSTMLWEIDDTFAGMGQSTPTLIIVQVGVGSFADAVVRHYRQNLQHNPVIVGVEPDGAACVLAAVKAGRVVGLPGHQSSIMAGLNCGTASTLSFRTLREGMDCFITIGDERAGEAMRLIAEEGMVSGETGSAGLAGLMEVISGDQELLRQLGINTSTRALIISTEGSTDPVLYETIVGKSPDKVRNACL